MTYELMGKLGRIPDTHKSTDLQLRSYYDAGKLIEASQAPVAPDWGSFFLPGGGRPKKDVDVLGNNVAGCCVLSMVGHSINMVGQHTGRRDLVVSTKQILDEYKRRTGWNEVTGANDKGLVIREVLTDWKRGMFGTRLIGACAVDPTDPAQVALGLWLGGGLLGGYAMPKDWRTPEDDKGRMLWDKPAGGWPKDGGPGTGGGHAIYKRATSPRLDNFISWGLEVDATVVWRRDCNSELYLGIVEEWILPTGRAPNGFALDDLIADMRARGTDI